MMAVIAAPMLIKLEMASVMKKIKMKSVNLIGQIAAKTGNQLMTPFAMLKIIMNIVTLMEEIVVFMLGLEMAFVMVITTIHDVVPMMKVTAVLKTQLQTTALIANAMKMAYSSEM